MLHIASNEKPNFTIVNETYDLLNPTEYMQQVDKEFLLYRPSSNAPLREMRIRSFKPILTKDIQNATKLNSTIDIIPVINKIDPITKYASTVYKPEYALYNVKNNIALPVTKAKYNAEFTGNTESFVNNVNDAIASYCENFDWNGNFVFSDPEFTTPNKLIIDYNSSISISTPEYLNEEFSNVIGLDENSYIASKGTNLYKGNITDLIQIPNADIQYPITNCAKFVDDDFIYSDYNTLWYYNGSITTAIARGSVAAIVSNQRNSGLLILNNELYSYFENTIEKINISFTPVSLFRGEGIFIATDTSDIILYSDDGINWIPSTTTMSNLKGIFKIYDNTIIAYNDRQVYRLDSNLELKEIIYNKFDSDTTPKIISCGYRQNILLISTYIGVIWTDDLKTLKTISTETDYKVQSGETNCVLYTDKIYSTVNGPSDNITIEIPTPIELSQQYDYVIPSIDGNFIYSKNGNLYHGTPNNISSININLPGELNYCSYNGNGVSFYIVVNKKLYRNDGKVTTAIAIPDNITTFASKQENDGVVVVNSKTYRLNGANFTEIFPPRVPTFISAINDEYWMVGDNNAIYHSTLESGSPWLNTVQYITNCLGIFELTKGIIVAWNNDHALIISTKTMSRIEEIYVNGTMKSCGYVDKILVLISDSEIAYTSNFKLVKDISLTNDYIISSGTKTYLTTKTNYTNINIVPTPVTIEQYYNAYMSISQKDEILTRQFTVLDKYSLQTTNLSFNLGEYVLTFIIEVNIAPFDIFNTSTYKQIYNAMSFLPLTWVILNNNCTTLSINYAQNVIRSQYLYEGKTLTLTSPFMNNLSQKIYTDYTEAQVVFKRLDVMPSSNYFPVRIMDKSNTVIDLTYLNTIYDQIIVEIDYVYEAV